MKGARSGGAGLAYALVILAALGGVLTIAGPGERSAAVAPAHDPGAQPGQLGQRQLTRISVEATPEVARRVEAIRDLRFDHLPVPEVVSSAFLNRLALRELHRHGGGLGIGADEAVGRITGLLAPDEQLEDAYRSTGDLAAAAYDPETQRLYVVRDAVVTNRALVEFLLAHELDHALEDQRFGIGGGGQNKAPQRRRGSASLRSAQNKAPQRRRGDDDQALARQALHEGSATSVMTDFGARYLDPLELLAGSQGIDADTGDVPKVFVEQLTWTYLGGDDFINELRGLAHGWKLVDYALDSRPPASTEQILHPEKYVRDERPAVVRIDPAELRRRGWRPADRGVLGELSTTYLLRLGDPALASPAAAGWDGDRYELWRRDQPARGCQDPCRDAFVLVMRWRWDAQRDAGEFARAAAAYLEQSLGGIAAGEDGWQLGETAAALASGPQDSTLVFAPDLQTARALAAEQH